MKRQKIEAIVKEFIKGTGLFLVAVKVSSSNRITVLADTNEGITIDECACNSQVILRRTSTATQRILNCRFHHPVSICLSVLLNSITRMKAEELRLLIMKE
ncbi:MAG: hypothetical protein MZV63_70150 [Marinilabiliales bacterium]|nr:hypothetical protein [Marinilabiliales bacterium]